MSSKDLSTSGTASDATAYACKATSVDTTSRQHTTASTGSDEVAEPQSIETDSSPVPAPLGPTVNTSPAVKRKHKKAPKDPSNYPCQIDPDSSIPENVQRLIQWTDLHRLEWRDILRMWDADNPRDVSQKGIRYALNIYRHHAPMYYEEKGVPTPVSTTSLEEGELSDEGPEM
jgi:hypothetical protein